MTNKEFIDMLITLGKMKNDFERKRRDEFNIVVNSNVNIVKLLKLPIKYKYEGLYDRYSSICVLTILALEKVNRDQQIKTINNIHDTIDIYSEFATNIEVINILSDIESYLKKLEKMAITLDKFNELIKSYKVVQFFNSRTFKIKNNTYKAVKDTSNKYKFSVVCLEDNSIYTKVNYMLIDKNKNVRCLKDKDNCLEHIKKLYKNENIRLLVLTRGIALGDIIND